jgi:sortase A
MLLKVGAVLMAFALAFAGVVAVVAFLDEPMQTASATKPPPEPTVEPLVRSKPTVEPWAEKSRAAAPEPEPEVKKVEARPEPKPRPEQPTEPERETFPVARDADWPTPTPEQVEAASGPRRYELPDGAIMGLTINVLGLRNVPVFDSDGAWALENGVSHEPGTSMPWSRAEQRNVYLQGHRFGWPGTGSHLVFYHLNRLSEGEEVVLKNRDGEKFRYKVSEIFVVEPNDSWVMGRVRGRDIVTLQTCTPIPTFQKRLVVRADRV